MELRQESEVPSDVKVLHNGFWVYAETGEFVSPDEIVDDEPWQIGDDLGRAEWVMEKMGLEEGEIAALEARKKMLIANIDSMIADRRAILNGLHFKFDEPLKLFAIGRLAVSRTVTKTFKTAFGQLSFQSSKGTNTIRDMEWAVKWALLHVPSAVKRTVNVSDLLPHIEEFPEDVSEWLDQSGPKENFSIRTGVAR